MPQLTKPKLIKFLKNFQFFSLTFEKKNFFFFAIVGISNQVKFFFFNSKFCFVTRFANKFCWIIFFFEWSHHDYGSRIIIDQFLAHISVLFCATFVFGFYGILKVKNGPFFLNGILICKIVASFQLFQILVNHLSAFFFDF